MSSRPACSSPPPPTVPHEHLCSDLMSFKNPDCERLLGCPLEPPGCFQSPTPLYSLWLFTGRTEVTDLTKLPQESQHVARARTLGPLKSPKNEARLVHYRGGGRRVARRMCGCSCGTQKDVHSAQAQSAICLSASAPSRKHPREAAG